MFDKWHKKEKPVFTGYWFGFGAAAGSGADDDSGGGANLSGGNVEYTLMALIKFTFLLHLEH